MLRAGLAKAPLRLPDDLGLFGFGPGGGRGHAVPRGCAEHDQLEARALWLDDDGEQLLLVTLDLVAGSRLVQSGLHERLALRGVVLPRERIVVVGTHTHSAPGHFLGNLYDYFGHFPLGTRADVVDLLVEASLHASLAARAAAVPCRVGFSRRVLWRAGRNRSYRAFAANFESPSDWAKELRIEAPEALSPEEKAIDPRLSVAAFVADDGALIGSWASWCCHAASLPSAPLRPYHRDWPGVAVDLVDGHGGIHFVHQGANGDVTALRTGDARSEHPVARMRTLGRRIGRAWLEGVEAARASATEVGLELRAHALRPAEASLPPFEIGAPVLLGSEEAKRGLSAQLFGEARRLPFRRGPQGPKLPALGPLQFALRRFTRLAPSAEHPMWLVRLGSLVFFASPFEQTTMAARTAEKALVEAFRTKRGVDVEAIPIGLAGDYAGYVTTPLEYHQQHYEGAHTLYGPGQLQALIDAWCAMV